MDIGTPPLRRSRDRRIIAGVLGGIAERFDLNVTLLRVLYVIVSIASAAFPGILVYLILWLLIPVRRPEDVGPARA
jgi:phage shock protein PspC (stress-responsive transcriptional regulator)